MAVASQAASSSCLLHATQFSHKQRVSFPVSTSLCSCFSRRVSVRPLLQECCRPCAALWVFPVSQIATDGLTNAAAVAIPKLDIKSEEDAPQGTPVAAKEENISAVMADVENLIKLMDSRDIVELELKHPDYELLLRKKEALPPRAAPLATSPQVATQTPYLAFAPPTLTPYAPSATPTPAPAAVSPPAPPAQSASNLPRILSPMAGTLYKSPGPGEPPFVKVGDKVSKGQVICIVEAMKLMNEIEADQTGTIVEILAEDGKPVSVDTPLFTIKS